MAKIGDLDNMYRLLYTQEYDVQYAADYCYFCYTHKFFFLHTSMLF